MSFLYDEEWRMEDRMTQQFNFVLRDIDREALDRLADIMDCSRSEVIREAIRTLSLRYHI